MNRVVVDSTLRQRLGKLDEPFEFCDEAGHALGRFLPAVNPLDYEGLEPRVSREELDRRKKNKGQTFSTAEVLARLEQLDVSR